MERVHHIDPHNATTLPELIQAMTKVGVLGAGRMGRASEIVKRIFTTPNCFTFLSLSGPMIPGGLRTLVSYLIKEGYIDALITSGANIVHDLIEAYGGAHYKLAVKKDDAELRKSGMGRIADIYVNERDFEVFEKEIYGFLDSLSEEQRTTMSPSEFLHKLGMLLDDEKSIVRQAALKNISIFSPGLMDSMLGLHLYTYSTTQKINLDFVKDLRILGALITEAKETGAIMLGGGLTKHFTMGSTILRGGLDLAVQITLDRPEGGSLSGAPLEEGISWQKVQVEANYETVIGDATIIFPFLILASLHGTP